MIIRPYDPADLKAVRSICCDTANGGDALDPSLFDPELYADYWTNYYVRFEPDFIWVSVDEISERVTGYIMGSRNTVRFRRVMKWRVFPGLFLKYMLNGKFFFSPPVRSFLLKRIEIWWGTPALTPAILEKYPGHLHINILASFRGVHTGKELLHVLTKAAHDAGVAGLHLETHEDNVKARGFFEHAGFGFVTKHLPFKKKFPEPKDKYILVLGKRLTFSS